MWRDATDAGSTGVSAGIYSRTSETVHNSTLYLPASTAAPDSSRIRIEFLGVRDLLLQLVGSTTKREQGRHLKLSDFVWRIARTAYNEWWDNALRRCNTR